MKRIIPLTILAGAAMCASLYADDPAPAEGKAGDAQEEKVKSVKRPKKKLEYISAMEAKGAAEAWECPVVVLVTLQGSKNSMKIVNNYFMKPDLKKEFFLPNAVFCRINVPQLVDKRRRPPADKDKKDPPVIPDLERLKPDLLAAVREITASVNARKVTENDFPQLVVLSHKGKVLQNCTPSPDGSTPLKELVKMIESAMKAGKYETVVTPKMQKIIDKDSAARERAAKRAAK